MTDKQEETSNFSFRMFDIYRRFVEVLQNNPEFLEEFQIGPPKEGTCRTIIKKIFQLRQPEEKIQNFIKYLTKNAKLIASHAQDIPSNWNEAILYTDNCIKQIRKYLKRKNISTKSDLDSVKELAQDIGEYLHSNPSERQIEAIREYLKYDIRNPKRTITSPSMSKKSKSKTPKSSKTSDKTKNFDAVQIKRDNLKMVIKKLQYESAVINEVEKVTDEQENNEITETPHIREELSGIEEDEKDSSVDSAQDSLEDSCKKPNCSYSSEEVILDPNKLRDPEYIKSILINSGNFDNISDEFMIIEIDERAENFLEENKVRRETINSNDSLFDYCYRLKRRNSSCTEDEDQNYSKKFISSDMQKAEKIQIPVSGISDNASINNDYNNSNSSEINVKDEANFENKPDPIVLSIKEIQNKAAPSLDNKIEENASFINNNFNWKERYNPECDVKYANVVNMTYTEVLKLIETVMAFCELRNEISLEEFLILRRTRDKMHWRSMKEIH